MNDGKTSFIPRLDLPFKSGEYKITVEHNLEDTRQQGAAFGRETLTSEYTLLVAGERFRLAEDDIGAVSPGDGRVGEFSNHLPHIVLDKADLPWQRAVDVNAPAADSLPWLALLVFDGDALPQSQEINLRDLKQPPKGTFHPKIQFSRRDNLESGEKGDRCRVIDISKELFLAIAPSLEELPLLAHVRDVPLGEKVLEHHALSMLNRENSELLRDAQPRAKHAVLIANRLPGVGDDADPEGHANRVHLVSLEGFGSFLPKEGVESKLPADAEYVRLVTLHTWDFGVKRGREHLYSLETVSHALQAESLRVPPAPITANGDEIDKQLKGILSLGYIPLNHHTRTDDQTVSWYRGPLVPEAVELASSAPVRCADEGVRYDPEVTGMFDVSYAAAWQLGRLLALHDREFAESLSFWRRTLIRETQLLCERERWAKAVGFELSSSDTKETVVQNILSSLTNSLRAYLNGEPDTSTTTIKSEVVSEQTYYNELISTMTSVERIRELHGSRKSLAFTAQEDACGSWLGALKLLHGVPFHYLLPDPRLLPEVDEGSLRLFHIDPNWIHHLLQGAKSLGVNDEVAWSHDMAFADELFVAADRAAATLRSRSLGKSGAELANVEPYQGPISGFLLRSSLLADWPGLEVQAYDKDGFDLQLLRMEPLSNTVLLAIFSGRIKKLVFQEPSEELHFGLTKTAGWKKVPRKRDGRSAGEGKAVAVNFRGEGEMGTHRVVKIKQLAKYMRKIIDNRSVLSVDSALFGLQMVESGDRIEFTWHEVTS